MKEKSRTIKLLYIFIGTFFLIIGILGIFLPLLPATPFLLLTAFFYAKSSKKLYDWLLSKKWLSAYIVHYKKGTGIDPKIKIITLVILWLSITISIYNVFSKFNIVIILFCIAVGVSIHILLIPNIKK